MKANRRKLSQADARRLIVLQGIKPNLVVHHDIDGCVFSLPVPDTRIGNAIVRALRELAAPKPHPYRWILENVADWTEEAQQTVRRNDPYGTEAKLRTILERVTEQIIKIQERAEPWLKR